MRLNDVQRLVSLLIEWGNPSDELPFLTLADPGGIIEANAHLFVN